MIIIVLLLHLEKVVRLFKTKGLREIVGSFAFFIVLRIFNKCLYGKNKLFIKRRIQNEGIYGFARKFE